MAVSRYECDGRKCPTSTLVLFAVDYLGVEQCCGYTMYLNKVGSYTL